MFCQVHILGLSAVTYQILRQFSIDFYENKRKGEQGSLTNHKTNKWVITSNKYMVGYDMAFRCKLNLSGTLIQVMMQ